MDERPAQAPAPKRVHPVVQPTTMRASYADEPVRLDAPAGGGGGRDGLSLFGGAFQRYDKPASAAPSPA